MEEREHKVGHALDGLLCILLELELSMMLVGCAQHLERQNECSILINTAWLLSFNTAMYACI